MQSSIKKNTAYNMIKTLAGIIFPLITTPYISRILQPENVGKVNFGNSIISYFSLAATLGVTTYAVRECSAVRFDQKRLERTASEILSINVVTMCISYAVLALCMIFVPKLADYRLLLAIQSLSIIFQVIGADWLNTSMEDFRYLTLRTVSLQLVALILMFLLVREPEDYIRYAAISLVASSMGNLCNVFYRKKYGDVHFVKQMNWKKHMPAILGLFAMLLSQTIMNNIDITMLGLMKGNYDVGLYSTASKVVNIIAQVVVSITWVVMPRLSMGFHSGDYKSINSLLRIVLNVTLTLGLPCIAGLLVLSEEISVIVGGTEYIAIAPCLCILILGRLTDLLWCNIWGNCVLLPSKREKQFMLACTAAMITNVIGNLILIPSFGIEGASVATGISYFVIGMISIQRKDKNIKIQCGRNMISGPVVGSILIIVIGRVIKLLQLSMIPTVFITIIASVAIYTIVLTVLKNELTVSCLIKIKSALKR